MESKVLRQSPPNGLEEADTRAEERTTGQHRQDDGNDVASEEKYVQVDGSIL